MPALPTVNAPISRSAMAYVLAGGRGSRLHGTDRPARQARRLFRRQVAHHRFRAVERAQFRHPPHRRRDPIQGAQPDPPPAARLELLPPRAQRELRHPAGEPARLRDEWYAGTADAVYQNIDIIESYGPQYIVLLAGDHVYKMDYELMLQQHVERGADVTVGCIEVPRMEATGFRRDACRRPTDRLVSFLEKPKDPPGIPGNPDMALASMGIYVFETRFLFDQLRRDAADPHSPPRFRPGHHPATSSSTAGRGAPLRRCCVRSTVEVGSLLARRRHGRCLLGGQYRPHRRGPRTRSLRPRLADLDLWRDHAAGEVRPRRRPAAAARRSARWSPAAVSSRVRTRPLACCSPASMSIPMHGSQNAVVLPYAEIGRRPASSRGRRSRRSHPATAWLWARMPSSTPAASAAPIAVSA